MKKRKFDPGKPRSSWIVPPPSAGQDGKNPDVKDHLMELLSNQYKKNQGGDPVDYFSVVKAIFGQYQDALCREFPERFPSMDELRRLDVIDAFDLGRNGTIPMKECSWYPASLANPICAYLPCFAKGIFIPPEIPLLLPAAIRFEVLDFSIEDNAAKIALTLYNEFTRDPDASAEPGLGVTFTVYAGHCGAAGIEDPKYAEWTREPEHEGVKSLPPAVVIDPDSRVSYSKLYTMIPPKALGWTRAQCGLWEKIILQNAVDQERRCELLEQDMFMSMAFRFLNGILAVNACLSSTKPVVERPPKKPSGKTAAPEKQDRPARNQDREPPARRVRTAGLIRFVSADVPRPAEKAARTYRLASWTARGHVRHYKNGKQVYIRPTVRHRKALKTERDPVPTTIRVKNNMPAEHEKED